MQEVETCERSGNREKGQKEMGIARERERERAVRRRESISLRVARCPKKERDGERESVATATLIF